MFIVLDNLSCSLSKRALMISMLVSLLLGRLIGYSGILESSSFRVPRIFSRRKNKMAIATTIKKIQSPALSSSSGVGVLGPKVGCWESGGIIFYLQGAAN